MLWRLNQNRHRWRRAIIALVLGMSLCLPALGDIYKYRDREGRVLLTDVPTKESRYTLEKRFRFKKYASPSSGGTLASLAVLKDRIKNLSPIVESVAAELQLEKDLLHAVILAESAYDSRAVSPKGAIGLMQLMPQTAKRFGVDDSYDPQQNVSGGATYLKHLLLRYDQNLQLALAAYNAGEGAVDKYGRQIPPYKETQQYVRKVLDFYGEGMSALNN